jgi:hypothetical protein
MQHAIKLALVDPKQLGYMNNHPEGKLVLVDPKHLEYRDLNKNPEGVAKAGISMEMHQLLDQPDMPDDLKMKLYRQMLDRFLKADSNEQPLPSINYEHQPVTPVNEPIAVHSSIRYPIITRGRKRVAPADSTTPKTKHKTPRRQQSPKWIEFK